MIILHTTKYGDSSLILHGYTRNGGRQSFLLRGVGKKNSGKSSSGKALGYLHPLSILDVVVSEGSRTKADETQGTGGAMLYLKEFSPKFNLFSLRSDIYKSSIAMYMSELLYKSLLENEQDPVLYDFLEKSIVTLDSLEANFANFHIWFTIQYASRLGFMPGNDFSIEYNPFSEEERQLLRKFINEDEEDAMIIPLRGEQRTAFLSSLLKYLEYHLGSRLNIKSLGVLHQVIG